MDSDISNKLNEILSDPEKLKGVMSVVNSVMGAQSHTHEKESPPIMPINAKDDKRTELLRALKPFLSEEKCARIDKILKIMTVAQLAGMITGEGPRG